MVLVTTFGILTYIISVPYVEKKVREMEEESSKTILESVYHMIEKIHLDIQSERRSVIEDRKKELKHIIEIVESYIKNIEKQVDEGLISREKAREKICEELRSFRYGNNDYIWVADYRSYLISHPDPKLYKADTSNLKDIHGKLIVYPMVKMARKKW